MKCGECGHWLTSRKTIYSDGSEIVNFKTSENMGLCRHLAVETPVHFGCLSFKEGGHEEIVNKDGAPWQHWHYGICPECNGRGSKPPPNERHCMRCIGTAHVRYYDDGYVGDEKTKTHPKEKEPVCVELKGTMLSPMGSPKQGAI